jgi:hypothetical protein
MAAWVYHWTKKGAPFSRTKTSTKRWGTGFISLTKLQFDLVQRWLDDALRIEAQQTLSPGHWYHVAVSYDGSRTADGAKTMLTGNLPRLGFYWTSFIKRLSPQNLSELAAVVAQRIASMVSSMT